MVPDRSDLSAESALSLPGIFISHDLESSTTILSTTFCKCKMRVIIVSELQRRVWMTESINLRIYSRRVSDSEGLRSRRRQIDWDQHCLECLHKTAFTSGLYVRYLFDTWECRDVEPTCVRMSNVRENCPIFSVATVAFSNIISMTITDYTWGCQGGPKLYTWNLMSHLLAYLLYIGTHVAVSCN